MTNTEMRERAQAWAESPYFKLLERALISIVTALSFWIFQSVNDIREQLADARAERAGFTLQINRNERDIANIEQRLDFMKP